MDKVCYVAGFLFSPDKLKVVLIHKNRPEFQRGKWNAVGGKIEAGETALDAMVREFREEAGLRVPSWNLFCHLDGPGYTVYFFSAESWDYHKVTSATDEEIDGWDVEEELSALPVMNNVKWLIPMALVGGRHHVTEEELT